MTPGILDAELRPVDELANRYYSHGFGQPRMHPLEALRRMRDGAVMGGTTAPMPEDELLFDAIRARMGVSQDIGVVTKRAVLDCWYATGGSSEQKARRLRISRSTLYAHWRGALTYVRGRFHERGVKI